MSNIIGEGFDSVIKRQIEIRQEKLGILDNISDDLIVWNNSLSWIRLASSVDVKDNSLLSKKNILFGGTLNFKESLNKWDLKSSFDENDSNNSGYEKGIFGFRPMPNINEVKVTFLNNGSLKKAEIKIKAYSVEQLEILDKLYLKLGYSILLEWGNSIYLNNQGVKESFNNFNTLPFDLFFQQGKSFQDILDSIVEEKKKYFGNYEAFLGKVINFNWDFDNGIYNINLTAISYGDIIESFKINNSLEVGNTTKLEDKDKSSIELFKDITLFNKFLYDATYNEGGELIVKDKYNLTNPNTRIIRKNYVGKKSWFGARESNNQTYITLGGLLEYLEKNQNLIINKNKNNLYFQFDYDFDKNYCLTFPGHFSSDPTICLIPIADLISKQKIQEDMIGFNLNNNPYIGKVMYILVNLELIAFMLYSLRNEKTGVVTLFDFLNGILNKINSSLGNINNLNLFYDSEENKIRIIEEAPLKYEGLKQTKKNEYTSLNIYGVSKNNGSFVKNFNFGVSISKEMASMVAIGASVNGNQPGTNATALSQLNIDLKDRLAPIKEPTAGNNQINNIDSLPETKYQKIIEKLNKYLIKVYQEKVLTEHHIKFIESLSNDYFKYNIGYLSSKQIPSPTFLPFKMNLSLKGIGGIKIYQRFNISENSLSILPSSYKDISGKPIVNFLIQNISHTIKNNIWETQIEALTTPAELETLIEIPIVTSNYIQEVQNQSLNNSSSSDRKNCKIKEIPKISKFLSINEVVDFFLNNNYSKQAASSMTANLFSESGLNLNAFNPAGGGCGAYGLAQWRGNRQDGLYNYAQSINKNIDDKEVQLNYILKELNKTEIYTKVKLQKAQTLEASNLAATSYERFEGYNDPTNPEVIKRLNKAKQIYSSLV